MTLAAQVGSGFHGGLMLKFGQYDIAYWGFSQGKNLVLKRNTSGTGNLISVTNSQSTVWLRVSKEGTKYSFYYKTSESAPWTKAGEQTWSSAPAKAGLILRTWSVAAVSLDFDDVTLSKTWQETSYDYDKVGNITSITDALAGETSTYQYDGFNRLTNFKLNGTSQEVYTYTVSTGTPFSKKLAGAASENIEGGLRICALSDCQGNLKNRPPNDYCNYCVAKGKSISKKTTRFQ